MELASAEARCGPRPGGLGFLGEDGVLRAALRELGRTAGEELLSAIDGRPSSGLRRLPCSLVLRESSRPSHPARA